MLIHYALPNRSKAILFGMLASSFGNVRQVVAESTAIVVELDDDCAVTRNKLQFYFTEVVASSEQSVDDLLVKWLTK